jgi:hypothetical protein
MRFFYQSTSPGPPNYCVTHDLCQGFKIRKNTKQLAKHEGILNHGCHSPVHILSETDDKK